MKLFLFAALTMTIALPAMAEEIKGQVIAPLTTFVSIGESAANREGKKFSIVVQPAGIGPGSGVVSSGGFTFSLFLDRDSMLSLDYTYGRGNDDGIIFSPHYETTEITSGLIYKRFFGNSFYVRGGLDYIQIRSDGTYSEFFSSQPNSYGRIEGNLVGAEVAIGNQWQWSNFTLGCDWVGYMRPVFSSVTKDTLSANATDYARSSQNSEKERLFVNGGLELLRFYLGASF